MTPRRKMLVRTFLALVVIAGTVFGIRFARNAYYERQLRELTDQLDAEDPGWRFEDIVASQPKLKDEENAAVAIVEALRKLTLLETIPSRSKSQWHRTYVNLFNVHKFDKYVEYFVQYPNGRLPPKWKANVSSLLATAPGPEFISDARNLRAYSTGRFNNKYRELALDTLMPDVQSARTIVDLLDWDARLQLEAGRADLALTDVSAMLGAARAFNHEIFVIPVLVRGAQVRVAANTVQRILAQGDRFDDATLRQVQQEFLAEEGLMQPLDRVLRSDRAAFEQSLRMFESGTVSLMRFFKRSGWPYARGAVKANVTGWGPADRVVEEIAPQLFIEPWARPRNWALERADTLRFYQPVIEWAKSPEMELLPRWRKLRETRVRPSPFSQGVLFSVTEKEYKEGNGYAWIEKLGWLWLEHRARCRFTAAALTCERYRMRHGVWPAKLDELVPEYLEKVPSDPYTGRALLIKRLEDGVVIYSVGRDEQDNGGNVLHESVISGRDVGLRLWDPAKRRVELKEKIAELESEEGEGK